MASARIKRSIADDNRIRRAEDEIRKFALLAEYPIDAEDRHKGPWDDAAHAALKAIAKLGPDEVHRAPALARLALKVY